MACFFFCSSLPPLCRVPRHLGRTRGAAPKMACFFFSVLLSLLLSAASPATWDDPAQPRFHIRTNCTACRSADPDFPFYDPRHGVYHLMFQFFPPDHPSGPITGHVASRLPVALTTDTWWDRVAIWTGSATVLDDGTPWLVYPGRCSPGVDGCSATGFSYAQATPADPDDALCERWSKRPPIVNDTFDDPSTAWRTAFGEWRFIGNSRIGMTGLRESPIFAAKDFVNGPWRRVGLVEDLRWGECPSLYPLPPLYPNTTTAGTTVLPSHVLKRSRQTHNCSGDCSGDTVSLGTWTDGRGEDTGTWQAAPGWPFDEMIIDGGNRYASKDFWDPVGGVAGGAGGGVVVGGGAVVGEAVGGRRPLGGRRINWGWMHIPGGGQTLPRVQTFHPQLQRLIHSPLPELARLRVGEPLARLASETRVHANVGLPVWPPPSTASGLRAELGRGNSSEVIATFRLPSAPRSGRFGVRVMMQQTGDGGASPRGGVLAFIDVAAGPRRAVQVGFTPPCEACSRPVETMPLLPGESEIALRIFSDRTVVEAYWADGRVAMTTAFQTTGEQQEGGGISVESSVDLSLVAAEAFELGSIWVPKKALE